MINIKSDEDLHLRPSVSVRHGAWLIMRHDDTWALFWADYKFAPIVGKKFLFNAVRVRLLILHKRGNITYNFQSNKPSCDHARKKPFFYEIPVLDLPGILKLIM
jgi:hypothetical protein